MTILAPTPLVKFEPVSRPDRQGVDRRQSNFARDIARDAFGRLGHLYDDQWADHVDLSPKTLTEKRKRVLWREPSS